MGDDTPLRQRQYPYTGLEKNCVRLFDPWFSCTVASHRPMWLRQIAPPTDRQADRQTGRQAERQTKLSMRSTNMFSPTQSMPFGETIRASDPAPRTANESYKTACRLGINLRGVRLRPLTIRLYSCPTGRSPVHLPLYMTKRASSAETEASFRTVCLHSTTNFKHGPHTIPDARFR